MWGGEDHIYTASEDRTIKVWNIKGEMVYDFRKHAHWVNTLALNTEYALKFKIINFN